MPGCQTGKTTSGVRSRRGHDWGGTGRTGEAQSYQGRYLRIKVSSLYEASTLVLLATWKEVRLNKPTLSMALFLPGTSTPITGTINEDEASLAGD